MATRNLGTLTLDLVARIGGFEQGMDRAARRSERTMKAIRTSVSRATKVLAGLGIAGAGFATALIKSQIDLADQTAKTADRLGLTTEELSKLRYAANLTGVESGTLDMALQRMTRRLSEAADGSGEAVGAIDELGLSAQALIRMGPDQAFKEIADAISRVPDQADRVRLAFKFFDSEGVSLVNTMAEGRQGVEAMGDELERLGGVIDQETARRAEQFNDNISRLGVVVRGTGISLASELLPDLVEFTDLIQEEETQRSIRRLVRGLADLAIQAVKVGRGLADFIGYLERIDVIQFEVRDKELEELEDRLGDIRKRIDNINDIPLGLGNNPLSQRALANYEAERDAIEGQIQALKTVDRLKDDIEEGERRRKELFDPALAVPPLLTGVGSGQSTREELRRRKELEEQTRQLNEEADKYIAQTERSIALLDQEGDLAQVLYDIERGRFKGLSSDRQQAVIDAAERIDAQREEIRLQEEMAASVRESMEAASGYRRLVMSEEQRALEDLKDRYEEVRQLVADGFLSPEEGAAATTKLKEDFDDVMDSMQERTDELSVYAKRAAENMQDAFADFLFDPFQDGLDGMLENFGRIIQRMAAEAAAAQVFDAIGGWGQQNAGAGGVTGLLADFAGFFDKGGTLGAGQWGIAGEKGPEVVHGPANILGREATAGMMSLSQAKGVSIGNMNMNFPGIGNAREAEAAAGAAGRRLLSTINNAQRYR